MSSAISVINETTLTNYVTLDSLILPWNPPGHLLKYGGVIGVRFAVRLMASK
jgi:hypothetical protein